MTNKTPLELLEERIEREANGIPSYIGVSRLSETSDDPSNLKDELEILIVDLRRRGKPESFIKTLERKMFFLALLDIRKRYLADPENVDLVYEMLAMSRGAV